MSPVAPVHTREYWLLVRRCLIDLFELTPAVAAERISELRKRRGARDKQEKLTLFHSQPVHIAASLAGQEEALSSDPELWNRYQALLASHATSERSEAKAEGNRPSLDAARVVRVGVRTREQALAKAV